LLSADMHRSDEDLEPCDARPTHTIESLDELPALVQTLLLERSS
jgi:hypothetical protein